MGSESLQCSRPFPHDLRNLFALTYLICYHVGRPIDTIGATKKCHHVT